MQYFGFDRPSFAFKTFGFGSSEFSPLDLFAWGKQGVWYDPSDKSTLFQDVAGTVPVTKDGDPVALMRDKSGNSNHAVQTVSTARPIYKTDGILHWLQLDGVDDYIQSGALSAPVFSSTTGLAVVGFNNIGSLSGVLEEKSTIISSADWRVVIYTSSYLANYSPQGVDKILIRDATAGNNIVSAYSRNNIFYAKVNSYEPATVSVLDNFSSQTMVTVGKQTVGDFYYKGDFYGAILVGGINNDSIVLNVGQYLATKSGVTL